LLIDLPWLETPFVFMSRRCWSAPAAGRFFRSVTYRYIERLARTPNRFRSVTVLGLHLNANVTNFVFSGIYFGNVPYEEHLTRYFAEHLGPGSVFVDVGANCGYFSMLAAGLTGESGRIFAFEPNPPVFRELADHLERNGLQDRVHTFELALSDRADSRTLFVTPQHSGLSTMVSESIVAAGHFGGATAVAVQTIRFDEWREKQSVGRVDLMKIDVEGFEAQVLAGMVESLRALRIRRVVCETNWDSPAHQLLVEIGFRPTALENVGSVWNIAYEL
jgi:FkbM family methyltransferase